MSTIYSRIKELCIRDNISIAKLEKELGFANASLKKWDSNDIAPSSSRVVPIANYFNVSTDYLLGLDSIMNRKGDIDDDTIICLQRAKENMNPQKYKKMAAMIKNTIDFCFMDDK